MSCVMEICHDMNVCHDMKLIYAAYLAKDENEYKILNMNRESSPHEVCLDDQYPT